MAIANGSSADMFAIVPGICDRIAADLQQVLRANAFSNRMLISPRRLNQIGTEEATRFSEFLVSTDTNSVIEHGVTLALEGVGHSTILSIGSALRRSCVSSGEHVLGSQNLADAAEVYTTALLQGYMQGREEDLRREQELTRAAYMRTLT